MRKTKEETSLAIKEVTGGLVEPELEGRKSEEDFSESADMPFFQQPLTLAPIEHLGAPAPKPAAIREYDLSTILPTKELEAHGKDGEGRYLLYPQAGESLAAFWLELKREIKALTEDDTDTLLVRLDRLRLQADAVESLAQNLFFRDHPGGRFTANRRVILVNPDENTRRYLERALRDENDLCLVLDTRRKASPADWTLMYVGKLQSNLREVLDFIRARDETTAKDVAAKFNIALSGVQTRLGELLQDGLVKRAPVPGEGRRKAYSYTFFHPAPEYLPESQPKQFAYTLYNPAALDKAKAYEEAIAVAVKNNDVANASLYATRMKALYEELGDRSGVARAVWNMGSIARSGRSERRFAEAHAFYQQSLEIYQAIEDKAGMAQAYHSLGLNLAEAGSSLSLSDLIITEEGSGPELVLNYYAKSIALRREAGLPDNTATLNNIAPVLNAMGRYQEAHDCCVKVFHIRLESGTLYQIGGSFSQFMLMAGHRREWERVAVLSGVVTKWFENIGTPYPSHARGFFDEACNAAKVSLGEEVYAAAVEKGRNMTREQAVDYAVNR